MPNDEKAIEYEKRFTAQETKMEHVEETIKEITKATNRRWGQLVKLGWLLLGVLSATAVAAFKAWFNTS